VNTGLLTRDQDALVVLPAEPEACKAIPAELARALFHDSSDALLIIDTSTERIADLNEAAERLLGEDRGTLIDTRIIDRLSTKRSQEAAMIATALKDATRFQSPDAFAVHSQLGNIAIPVELVLRPLGHGSQSLLQLRDRRTRRELEERATLAERELALILNTVPVAVWCAERDHDALASAAEGFAGWHFRYLSPAVEQVTGWPLVHFVGGPICLAQIIHPDDRAAMTTECSAFLLSPQSYFSMEVRLIGADGRERWVRADIQATRNAQGRAVRLDGVLTDISRPKLAELSLRESQHWLTRLLETNANGILILDLAGRISFVNPAAEQLIGRRNEELLDHDWNELPWRPEQGDSKTGSDLAYKTLQSSELLLDRSDGKTVTVSLSAAPLRDDGGRVTGVVVTFFDITQRKRAEEALRSNQERLSQIVEAVAEGLLLVDRDCRITFANAAAERLLQSSRQELQARAWHDLPWGTASDSLGGFAQHEINERVLARGETLIGAHLILGGTDGTSRTISASFSPLRDARRGVTGMVVSLTDDTARTRAEEAVRQSEQILAREHALLRSLLDSIPDFIFFKDREGIYRGCNPAFEAINGVREAQLVGQITRDLFPPEQAEAMEVEDREVYATGKPLRLEKSIGCRIFELVLNPMIGYEGKIIGLLGIGRDMTERRRLEEQLRQAGKMEAIGRLAGGVAHDFNNLLTIILGNLSLIPTLFAGSDEATELLSDSMKAAQRAAELTNQLLGFARRNPLTLTPLDLNRRVTETVQLLKRTIDPRISIETKLAADLGAVEADGSQMSQVLMNLCLNARDAMPEGGRITVETANVTLSELDVNGNLEARPGQFVHLRLSDNGPGIDSAIRARIFEPFFTTKPFGKGTGLGLAVVFGIVRHHQGWIECHSSPGEGTRFDVFLPRSAKDALPEQTKANSRPRTGHETILLVDDEPMIRELGRAILGRQGYRVILAEDGAIGVDTYQKQGEQIDLVILDLSMPNLSGKEALRQLRTIDPNVRVIFASGYSTDEFEPGELDGVLGFISKPYSAQDLYTSVRNALDNAPRNGTASSHL